MTSYLIDVNVWLAMTWELHPQHAPASRWYGSRDDDRFLFCRLTMLGFLRLLTNRQVMGDSTRTLAGALELYDRWTEDPRVELAAEGINAETLVRRAMQHHLHQAATKAIADCYLIGFAESIGAHLVTFDRGMASIAKFRRVPVIVLEPLNRRTSTTPKRRGGHST
jgi:toxin-antitoxin system PIN domain toxin